MLQWLIILGSALAGGLLILHAFGRTKEASERMLSTYQELLKKAIEQQKDDQDGDDE